MEKEEKENRHGGLVQRWLHPCGGGRGGKSQAISNLVVKKENFGGDRKLSLHVVEKKMREIDRDEAEAGNRKLSHLKQAVASDGCCRVWSKLDQGGKERRGFRTEFGHYSDRVISSDSVLCLWISIEETWLKECSLHSEILEHRGSGRPSLALTC